MQGTENKLAMQVRIEAYRYAPRQWCQKSILITPSVGDHRSTI
jgi:hypothetical protein